MVNVTHDQIWRAIRRGIPATLIAGLVGCAGLALTEVAPPVSSAMLGDEVDAESLARGRQIYLTGCVRCHSAQPVRQYSRQQWERLLPEMSRQTKLNANQSTELRAYVLAAIRDKNGVSEQPEMYNPTKNKAIGE